MTIGTSFSAPAFPPPPTTPPPAAPVAAPSAPVATPAPSALPASPAAAAQPKPVAEPPRGILIPFIQHAAKYSLGAAGAVGGLLAGGVAGVFIGGAMGAASGFNGKHASWSCMLHPMENVAGLAALPVHNGVKNLVGKIAPGNVATIAAKVLGGLAGAVSGGVLGALGVAWAGADVGARTFVKASNILFGEPPQRPDTSGKKTYEQGFLDKQVPEPTGEINPDSHHFFYINNAMEVLKNDAASDPKLQRVYDFMKSDPTHVDILHNGAWDLDTFLGSYGEGISLSTFHHFGEPFMPGFKSAEWQCRQAYDAASDAWKAGDRKKAIYYLGAAVHIPQDLSLPQHAVPGVSYVGKMLGHQMMEGYLETHFDQAVVDRGGAYWPDVHTPEDFCRRVADQSIAQYGAAVKEGWDYVKWADEKGIDPIAPPSGPGAPEFQLTVYEEAGQRAQRITPGFLEMFFRDMERQGYPI